LGTEIEELKDVVTRCERYGAELYDSSSLARATVMNQAAITKGLIKLLEGGQIGSKEKKEEVCHDCSFWADRDKECYLRCQPGSQACGKKGGTSQVCASQGDDSP
jgi:hypothetical protein